MRTPPKFRRALFGYKRSEVDAYFRMSSAELLSLQQRLRAKTEAENNPTRSDTELSRDKAWQELVELKRQHQQAIAELRGILQAHLRMLDDPVVDEIYDDEITQANENYLAMST